MTTQNLTYEDAVLCALNLVDGPAGLPVGVAAIAHDDADGDRFDVGEFEAFLSDGRDIMAVVVQDLALAVPIKNSAVVREVIRRQLKPMREQLRGIASTIDQLRLVALAASEAGVLDNAIDLLYAARDAVLTAKAQMLDSKWMTE